MSQKKKKCRHCSEKIKPDAIRCKHCGGYQNWRRHLNSLNTFLALSIAVVTVSTLLVTNWNRLFSDKSADLEFSFTTFDIKDDVFEVRLIVSNQTPFPAYINNLNLNYELDSVKLSVSFQVEDEKIEANSANEYKYKVSPKGVVAWIKDDYETYSNLYEAYFGLDSASAINDLPKPKPKLAHWLWYEIGAKEAKDRPFGTLYSSLNVLDGKKEIQIGYRTYDGFLIETDVFGGESLLSIFLDYYEERIVYLFK